MNEQWYPQQKQTRGNSHKEHTGELNCLYGRGISDKTTPLPARWCTLFHQLQLKWWPHQKEAINNCNLCSFIGGASALRGNPPHSDSINTKAVLYSHALLFSVTPSYSGVSHSALMNVNKQIHLSRKPFVWPLIASMTEWMISTPVAIN